MSDLYKKLEEAADVVSGTVGVLKSLCERIKQLESYLDRYKTITDALVVGEEYHKRLEILEQDVKKELGK